MPPDYLSYFAVILGGIQGTFDICQTSYTIHSKLKIFTLFLSHKWKYNIQADERLTKAKEKKSTMIFALFSTFQCPRQ